jgi:hypothetical protein
MECKSQCSLTKPLRVGYTAKAWTTVKEETGRRIPLSGYAGLCFMGGMQKEERRVKKLG